MATLKELRQTRIDKLEQLRKFGIEAYPARSHKDIDNAQIITNYETHEGKSYTLAGRITAIRKHGALCFMDIKDQTGKVQFYIKEEELQVNEGQEKTLAFSELSLLDVGDFVEGYGKVIKTPTGQISLEVQYLRILVKSLRPLPNDWEGLKDRETRYRRRYVDMVVNEEVRQRMERRSIFWQAHRDFFNERGFYEVNIPVLEHIPGGGDAVPFITHMNAIDEDFYLRISHELPLKRLIGGGFEKVYDIGARFRNEGLSDEHLPEHVAMEFYWAYADWKDGMKMIQELLTYVIKRVYGDQKIFKIQEFEVDFSKEWEILDFNTIMKDRYGIKDVYTITLDEVVALLKKNNIEFDRSVNIARGVDALWKRIRKTIGGPAFLINHPKYLSPLQKASIENPNMVERFQPIIAGSELGNGWTEVNDAIDQYERFVEQQRLRDSGDAEAQWLDIDYVEMLEYGMPPTFGYGHAERTFWFLEGVTAKEGVPFPHLKAETDNETKGIYPEVFGKQGKGKNQDFSKKIITITNSNVVDWQLLNTISHLCAYLGNRVDKGKIISRTSFTTKDGIAIPANSQYPIVALDANTEQLKSLLTAIMGRKDIEFLIYTNEMIKYTDDEKLATALAQVESGNLEICGIGIFGTNQVLKELTGGLPLHK